MILQQADLPDLVFFLWFLRFCLFWTVNVPCALMLVRMRERAFKIKAA